MPKLNNRTIIVSSKTSDKFYTQSYDPWGWCWSHDLQIAEFIPVEKRAIRPERIPSVNHRKHGQGRNERYQ